MAIFWWRPPNGGIKCRWSGQKSRFLMNSWLLIDDWRSANNNCDCPTCRLLHSHTSVILFITTSMDDHDEEKRREQIWIVCSSKSEAELVLDILYCWSYWLTRSITRPLCDSRARDVNRGSKNRNSLQFRVLEIEFLNSKLDFTFWISANVTVSTLIN